MIRFASAAFVAAPFVVVLHELGHWAASKLFGFPGVVLHYASVTDAAAGPAWQKGLVAAAGPLLTLSLLGGCILARRRWPPAVLLALAFPAGIRALALTASGANADVFDELAATRALDLPVPLVLGVNAALIVVAWVILARGRRREELFASATGSIAGLALWLGWLGPRLLP